MPSRPNRLVRCAIAATIASSLPTHAQPAADAGTQAPGSPPSASPADAARSLPPAPAGGALPALPPVSPVSPATPPGTGESSFDLGEVTVTARGRGPLSTRSLLTSVDVLNASKLQSQTVESTFQLFGLAPGVMLTDFNQGTTSGKISLRGFNGEGEVNAVKLLIDGTPSNSNDGNMPFLDMVFPLELQAIEVVRGTNDARYGLHNIAGNVNLVTRQGGNATVGRVGVGSFGLLDVQAAKDIEGESWAQNYFVGARRSSGWRDHSDNERATLAGKWFFANERDTVRAGLVVRHFAQRAEEPGYLTFADSRRDPRQSYAFSATDGGRRQLSQVSVPLEGRLTADLSWAALVYLNRFDDRRFVRFSAQVSQQERFTDESHVGGRATLSWRPKVQALHEFALEGGVDTERQDNRSERYLTTERARDRQTRDQAWRFNVQGAYVQSVLRPLASLKIVPAYRIDTVTGSLDDRLAGATYPVNDYGVIRQPKISAVWTPVDGYAGYANWGRTFQLGVGPAAFKIPPRQVDLRPSINDGWEAGLKFAPATWLDGRVATWAQTATNEVVRILNSPTGDSVNIGSTRRRGIDLQLALRPASTLEAWFALTRQKAVIVEPDPAAPATRGREIDHTPRHVFNAGVDWRATPALRLSAWMQGQGDYYLERTNTRGRFGGYRLLNLGAIYSISPRLRLEAQVRNVTGRYYEYAWWDGIQTLHSPGLPRAFSIALSGSL